MKILIVGSGGREHALAWKIAQSPHLEKLYIAPGNAGSASLGENVAIAAENINGLVQFSKEKMIDLVVIGPEVPLTLGLADRLREAGIRAFGPSQQAAEIESSKVFSKAFMERHNIPSAQYAAFSDYEEALKFVETAPFPLVIKASGLAAGKGVILPNSLTEAKQALKEILLEKAFGDSGSQVIIEERLEGEEISLMAFTDGTSYRIMPPAQDHKRLMDNDKGSNTGGMGAYAPAPICPLNKAEEYARLTILPAVQGMKAEGMPFIGVLYAGLMLTPNGVKVLEYNGRFGDPETQVVLPLLDSDFLEIATACVEGRLDSIDIRWKSGSSVCVVVAGEKYPLSSSNGEIIQGLSSLLPDTVVFHAGTVNQVNQVVTHGGRILGVTAWSNNLPSAIEKAYQAVEKVYFKGMQFRKDIGQKGLTRIAKDNSSAYSKAGVNIDSGNKAVELMAAAVRSTYSPAVLAGIGSFGGLFDGAVLKTMNHPVLVASTDGVGTKVKIAAQVGRYRSIGQDMVNHCIDDILVQGARPLFFLDYIASSKLNPEMVAEIVNGMAEACKESSCVLIGGETAEMPGVYQSGEFDIAGTIVGVLENDCLLPKQNIQAGDCLLGIRSSGPHTNGYSLIRSILQDVSLDIVIPGAEKPLADILLEPHRSYLGLLGALVNDPTSSIKGLAHITGGGFIENIPRILPKNLDAAIHWGSWPIPALYPFLQERGNISLEEMARVFNLGIGMIAIISPNQVEETRNRIAEETWVIGEIIPGSRKTIMDWSYGK